MPDLSALMGQMQAMMAPHEGPVNWNLAKDIARRTAAAAARPEPRPRRPDRVADAVRLADHWLDGGHRAPLRRDAPPRPGAAPSGSSRPPTSGSVLVEPVAEHVVGAMGKAHARGGAGRWPAR